MYNLRISAHMRHIPETKHFFVYFNVTSLMSYVQKDFENSQIEKVQIYCYEPSKNYPFRETSHLTTVKHSTAVKN